MPPKKTAVKPTGDAKLDELVAKWLEWDSTPATRREIEQLASKPDVAELRARLAKRIAFGTAGLRGPMRAGFACMNNLTVQQASQGLCTSVAELVADAKKRGVVVGYDGRHHSREFAEITARVFLSRGFTVLLYPRVVPTPFVPFAVTHLKLAAGVMVTASHNPKQDNGYKVYWDNGCQIVSPIDAHIANKINENLVPWDLLTAPAISTARDPLPEVMKLYYSAMLPLRSSGAPPSMKIVYTAMHGVGADYVKKAFETFGLAPYIGVEKQLQPDPEFPTVTFPNPEEGREALDLAIETAKRVGSPLILATDPDADRLAVAERNPDGTWRLFTGNEIGILLASWAWQNFRARSPAIKPADCVMLTTAVSSRMLSAFAKSEGITFQETLTGFKWLGTAAHAQIKAGKHFVFAFEEAIGFMIGDMSLDKDGVRAAAVFADMARTLARDGLSCADQLLKLYRKYGYHATCNKYFFCYDPAVLESIFGRLRKDGHYAQTIGSWKVKHVRDLTVGYDDAQPENKPVLPTSASTQMITYTFENGCTATLRGSGTEPKLKYYIEYPGEFSQRDKVDKELAEMVKAIIAECLRPAENGLKPPTS
eukprot:m51a1_g1707 putative phosphoglucomutase (595) ;mRNA; f:520686-523111